MNTLCKKICTQFIPVLAHRIIKHKHINANGFIYNPTHNPLRGKNISVPKFKHLLCQDVKEIFSISSYSHLSHFMLNFLDFFSVDVSLTTPTRKHRGCKLLSSAVFQKVFRSITTIKTTKDLDYKVGNKVEEFLLNIFVFRFRTQNSLRSRPRFDATSRYCYLITHYLAVVTCWLELVRYAAISTYPLFRLGNSFVVNLIGLILRFQEEPLQEAKNLQGWGFDFHLPLVCIKFACFPHASGVFSPSPKTCAVS